MRALMAKVLQGDDPDGDAISKICSLINARRSNLVAIGLERCSITLDVGEYVAQKDAENRTGATIGPQSDPEPEDDEPRARHAGTGGAPESTRSGVAEQREVGDGDHETTESGSPKAQRRVETSPSRGAGIAEINGGT